MIKASYILLALISFISFSVQAESSNISKQSDVVKKLITKYAVEAKKDDPKSTFSAAAGREFYLWRRSYGPLDVSCSSCHTDNPASEGKHNETNKPIRPLAPSANPDRFTNADKADQAIAKHCKDMYRKDCSPQQKGDFLTFLISVK